MNLIIQKIKKYQYQKNSIEIVTFVIYSLVILLFCLQIFSIICLFYPQNFVNNYWISQILKYIWITLTIYLGLKFEKRLVNKFLTARLIDHTCHHQDDLITNAYQMIIHHPEGNKLLTQEFIKLTEEKIEHLTLIHDTTKLKWILYYCLLILLVMGLQVMIIGSPAWESMRSFFHYQRPSVFLQQKINIFPGSVRIARGASIDINILNPLENIEYFYHYQYEDLWRTESFDNQHKSINNIERNFVYYISNQWASSDTFNVTVLEDPNVRKISLQYSYPAYINKKSEFIENSDGVITVPQFTQVGISIQTPETISVAHLVFFDKSFLSMASQGRNTWEVIFTPDKTTNYHFSLVDELGNWSQIVNRPISLIPDQVPRINFTYPAKDTLMTQNNLFEVGLIASDDYGLKNLKLSYSINHKVVIDTLLLKNINSNFISLSHLIDFRKNALFPGDEVEYWAEIYDNSPMNQKAETSKYRLIFPSMEDIFKAIEKQEQEQFDILAKTLDQVQDMQKEFDLKKREMLRQNEANWDDQKALEKFIEDQKQMNDKIENLAANYDEMIQNLEKNEAISQDILNKMQKIQEIMEQISSEDFKKAMEQLQNSIENMDQESLRQAMENFQFNLDDFTEKLEQTLSLLENIKNEQNLEKQLEIAKEMQRMQEDLLQKTESSNNLEGLSEEQQKIEEKLKALKEQMQKTLDDLENTKNQNMYQEMQELLQDLENSQLSENLQDASQAMENNQKNAAMNKQQQSLEQMNKMITKMEKMKSEMSGAGMQEMVDAIQQTIFRLLMISKEHGEKVNRIGNDPLPWRESLINDFESIQLSINQLYVNPQILLFLGQKFFTDLNMIITSYRTLFQDLQNSRFHTHKKLTTDILSGLNLVIFDLMQTLNNMESQGQGSSGSSGMQSLMQQLEQMSAQQMMMNSLSYELFEQMSQNGNQITSQMRQQLQDIAADEQRLADNLQRLVHTNQDAQKHSNTLNEIAKELQDVSNRIRQNRIDRNLIEQQNRIMSRLINVQRSINQRDKSTQRKGETAQEQAWDLPPELNFNLNNLSDRKLFEEEIQKLPLEYRQIILEYLRRLNE